ncbi:glycosyltransferase involved in cell wall biosynthesis [Virgibacillus natechei]|uniref:Glycosyltransferase involved in cell wall biosynthesis n=1 Tax=Virgibacillus natechei TaxID=1216297 RepID=A0ABS4IKK1_9BACI|nr:glycosyltransferase [Virgibacillus natechei]MBP1971488.1 glycosyltransferase involved in cell wall biosynthesis [Virgibacillus natechei]UZD12542.1 glycosyltransferase [Virgibacillus natechei]
MEKKKVLFFIYQMGAGGAARTLLNIINNLDRTKFTPILVTLNYNGSYEEYIKSDVTFIKLDTKRLRSAIFPLAKVIREEKAAIVFSTIPNYNTIAILANLFSFTGAKNIVREAAYLGGSPSENMKLLAYGMLYKLSSKVIALSEGVKENIIKRYKIKPKKIKVIYNPVDLDSIKKNIEHEEVANEHQAIFKEEDAKIIITAGRLVKDKDHETLIRAFAKVNERITAKLVILGEGELEEDLKRTAYNQNVLDKVHFIGFQQNPYIYFKQADVFVLSSKREGFGHVLAEALATGVPVVSTNCKPGAQEVLNYGEFGRMCEVGNAEEMAAKINEILNLNEEQTAQIIDKGLGRANEFNAKKIVKQYEEAFNQTIDQIEK